MDVFQYCVVKCKKCFLELDSADEIKNHCQSCSVKPNENSELIAERAKVWALSKIFESVSGIKIKGLEGPIENVGKISEEMEVISSIPKKKIGKTIGKKKGPSPPELNEDESKIDIALSKINAKNNLFFDVSREEIEERLPKLEKWEDIKDDRTRIIRYISGREWENMIKGHWNVYKSDENLELVSEYFTTIEQRVIDNLRYAMTITPSDVSTYKIGMSLQTYEADIFELDKFTENFINIKLILMPIDNILLEYFQKCPKTLVYLPIRNIDSYTFFSLEKFEGINCWRYDCRLEKVGEHLYSEIVKYLIYYFRKVYLYIFGDNDFHPEIYTKNSNFDLEIRQILHNLIWCESSAKFIKNLADIVKKHCSVTPEHSVKFPSYTENKEQGKRLKIEQKIPTNGKILSDLFDHIEIKDLEELVKFVKD